MSENISLSELNQLRRNHQQIWPNDLIQDINEGDEYPQVCEERKAYDRLIAQELSKRKEEKKTQSTMKNNQMFPLLL